MTRLTALSLKLWMIIVFLTRSFNWSHVKCRNITNLKRLYAQTSRKKQTNSRQPNHEKIKNQIRSPAQIWTKFWAKKHKTISLSFEKQMNFFLNITFGAWVYLHIIKTCSSVSTWLRFLWMIVSPQSFKKKYVILHAKLLLLFLRQIKTRFVFHRWRLSLSFLWRKAITLLHTRVCVTAQQGKM